MPDKTPYGETRDRIEESFYVDTRTFKKAAWWFFFVLMSLIFYPFMVGWCIYDGDYGLALVNFVFSLIFAGCMGYVKATMVDR